MHERWNKPTYNFTLVIPITKISAIGINPYNCPYTRFQLLASILTERYNCPYTICREKMMCWAKEHKIVKNVRLNNTSICIPNEILAFIVISNSRYRKMPQGRKERGWEVLRRRRFSSMKDFFPGFSRC